MRFIHTDGRRNIAYMLPYKEEKNEAEYSSNHSGNQ